MTALVNNDIPPNVAFFFKKFNEMLDAMPSPIKVRLISPLEKIQKSQIIQMIYELDGNLDYFKNSITCYDPTEDGKSCGKIWFG